MDRLRQAALHTGYNPKPRGLCILSTLHVYSARVIEAKHSTSAVAHIFGLTLLSLYDIDPLSVANSIAGLMVAACQVPSLLKDLVGSAKDAPKSAQAVSVGK